MPNFSTYIDSISDYQRLNNNPIKYNPINPYSSAAFSDTRGIEDIMNANPEIESDLEISKEAEYTNRFANFNLYGNVGKEVSGQLESVAKLGKGSLAGLTTASSIMGLSDDGNPYKYGDLEFAGNAAGVALGTTSLLAGATAATTAGTVIGGTAAGTAVAGGLSALAASGVGIPLAIGAGIAYSMYRKNQTKKKKEARETEIREETNERNKEISDAMSDSRDKRNRLSRAQDLSTGWNYDNQYGGYSNSYNEPYRLADEGMRHTKYNDGGMMNPVAEFTGNELIVNNQSEVEAGLAVNDYARAAKPIREALKNRTITPGEETHQGNPMPVDAEGNIYAGGGKLNFTVGEGAGVYDHATDQFNEGMSDIEISRVARNNINKWKSNEMY